MILSLYSFLLRCLLKFDLICIFLKQECQSSLKHKSELLAKLESQKETMANVISQLEKKYVFRKGKIFIVSICDSLSFKWSLNIRVHFELFFLIIFFNPNRNKCRFFSCIFLLFCIFIPLVDLDMLTRYQV